MMQLIKNSCWMRRRFLVLVLFKEVWSRLVYVISFNMCVHNGMHLNQSLFPRRRLIIWFYMCLNTHKKIIICWGATAAVIKSQNVIIMFQKKYKSYTIWQMFSSIFMNRISFYHVPFFFVLSPEVVEHNEEK